MAHVLLSLERELEQIRQSHLAKNRRSLGNLSASQAHAVQILTAAIISQLLHNVAQELENSAEDQKQPLSKVLSLLFQLSE